VHVEKNSTEEKYEVFFIDVLTLLYGLTTSIKEHDYGKI